MFSFGENGRLGWVWFFLIRMREYEGFGRDGLRGYYRWFLIFVYFLWGFCYIVFSFFLGLWVRVIFFLSGEISGNLGGEFWYGDWIGERGLIWSIDVWRWSEIKVLMFMRLVVGCVDFLVWLIVNYLVLLGFWGEFGFLLWYVSEI